MAPQPVEATSHAGGYLDQYNHCTCIGQVYAHAQFIVFMTKYDILPVVTKYDILGYEGQAIFVVILFKNTCLYTHSRFWVDNESVRFWCLN